MAERRGSISASIGIIFLAGGLLLALIIGLRWGLLPTERETRVVGAPVCQGVSGSGVAFTAETKDAALSGITIANDGRGVVYRSRANTRTEYTVAGRLLPDNCQVGFAGFCIGQALQDYTGGQALDQLWFILPKGDGDEDQAHYVHSGVVQELAPGTIGQRPGTCRGGAKEPRTIELASPSAPAGDGTYTLQFTAPHAATVGAAVRVTVDDAPPRWQQIGLDTTAADGFALRWSPSVPPGSAPMTYTVCWSGNVPGMAHGVAEVGANGVQRASEPDLRPEDLREAKAIACNDAGGGA